MIITDENLRPILFFNFIANVELPLIVCASFIIGHFPTQATKKLYHILMQTQVHDKHLVISKKITKT